MQIYPIKKFHFCMFLYVFACESFIFFHRLDRLDGHMRKRRTGGGIKRKRRKRKTPEGLARAKD